MAGSGRDWAPGQGRAALAVHLRRHHARGALLLLILFERIFFFFFADGLWRVRRSIQRQRCRVPRDLVGGGGGGGAVVGARCRGEPRSLFISNPALLFLLGGP